MARVVPRNKPPVKMDKNSGHANDPAPVWWPGDTTTDYQTIKFEDALSELKHYRHAAHAMLYATDGTAVFDLYPTKAAVMMQLRFDGLLGFPGGLVDEGETPVEAVNRELAEEIGCEDAQCTVTVSDHLQSYLHPVKQLVLHFFVKELALSKFQEIERNALLSHDYGSEVLGSVRPPLYTMEDGFLGFPAFLAQHFAGNARDQLLDALRIKHILTINYIEDSWKKAQSFVNKTGKQS